MTSQAGQGPEPGESPPPGAPRESILRDGLRGIALVTAATAGLGAVAAVIAAVVALLY